jgi:DNA segregation ATPase FtsK/SpoIIIE-like protein
VIVPLGIKADGRRLTIPIDQWHTLIGGLSGAGKSSTLRVLLIGAAQHPVALVLIDPKRIELGAWRPRASVVATEPREIAAALRLLIDVMDERYRALEHQGADPWTYGCLPLVLTVVDELTGVVASGNRELDRDNATRLRLLLERGRAAGMIVVAATQRPAHDVIPTYLRDLFTFRLSHATSTAEHSEMILGSRYEPGPHTLPVGAGSQGLAWCLLDGDRTPVLARVWWTSREFALEVARSTAHLRPAWEPAPA